MAPFFQDSPRYDDRRHAGKELAALLVRREWPAETLIVGLPRGGVPVAAEIAAQLKLPLDVILVRKLGLPEQPEVAMGAIASGGVSILNDWILAALPNPKEVLDAVSERERAELERRERLYHPGRGALEVDGQTVIVVDDGLATGATMQASITALRKRGAVRIHVAVPVGARGACERIAEVADELICPLIPEDFGAVGQYYENFAQTCDEDVTRLLAQPVHPS